MGKLIDLPNKDEFQLLKTCNIEFLQKDNMTAISCFQDGVEMTTLQKLDLVRWLIYLSHNELQIVEDEA